MRMERMKRTMFSISKTIVYGSLEMYMFLLIFIGANAQDSAQYLESAIKDLTKLNSYPSQRRMDHFRSVKTALPALPTFSPTKEELAQLYGSAIKKGDSVRIRTDDGPSIDAAVYELEDDDKQSSKLSDSSAYYFYYYPLKAFVDELTSGNDPPRAEIAHDVQPSDTFANHEVITTKPSLHQFHTHTHQHNIHILETKAPTETKKRKSLEPLFMAISGFIGMTVMFVLSALILPKIGALKPRGVKDSPEMTSILKVIFQAIEGYDCSERLACEFGKTAKAFNIHNNRFVKLIRRIGPNSLSKRLYDINKYSNKKYKCAVIQCKMKTKTKLLQSKKTGTKS